MSEPVPRPTARRLAASMGSVTAVTLLTLAAYLGAMVILGRLLPRDRFGYVTLWIYALNLLGAASLLGFHTAFLRHVPRARAGASRWPALLPRLSLLSAAAAALGASIFVAVYDAPLADGALLFAASTFLAASLFPVTVLQVFGRFALAQGINTLWRPALLVAAAAAWGLGGASPTALFVAVAAGALVQAAASFAALRPLPRGEAPVALRALAPDALAFSGLFVTATLLTRLDAFLLPKLLGLDALGIYSAVGFVTLTGYGVVALAVGQVIGPKLASREPVPLQKLAWVLGAGGCLAGALLAVFADRLVPLAFGGRYAGDHRLLVLLLAAAGVLQVLYAIPSGRVGILAGARVLRLHLLLSLSSLVLDAVLLVAFVPAWGLPGAAGAGVITWTWRAGLAWAVARRAT